MKNTSYIKIAFIVICSQLLYSCEYLAVSDELAGQLTKEEVFNKPDKTRQWHRHIFTAIPDYSNMYCPDGTELGLQNPWMGLTDEIEFGLGNSTRYVNETGFHEGNARYHRYKAIYKLVRQANIFLEEAHTIESIGETIDYLDAKELKELKAQARFLRAYYYHLLLELYGPVPLITDVIDPNHTGAIDFSRNSVDEIVDYICSELDEVIQEEGGLSDIETDENRLALPTKGVARAVKAKTLIFAASPLFNGGFAEALTITNPEDGKRLFPDHDPKKWSRALIAIEDFITFANANHYKLHKSYKEDGAYDPDQSLYDLFMSYNDEIIWASSKTWFNKLGDYGFDKFATPRSEMKGFQTTSVMQELVDDFHMIDGLSIKESPLYKEEGFTKVNGVDVYNMWTNREPRFYQTVFYQGRKWHISNREINLYLGSHNGAQAPDYPKTGYICYKRASRKIYNQGAHPRVHYRPSIIFRLADFYLLYAETLNEVRPSDPKIIEYVDKIRERAGIPKLADVKPEIIGDQEAQRKAIRMERRIELCTEGQRYFDVRRWMIAEEEGSKQGGDIHGMNMFGESGVKADFYKRTLVETRLFEKKYYLYPIPLSEIQISKKLVQNPLW